MNFTEIMMFQDSIDRHNYFEYLQEFNQNIQNNPFIPIDVKNKIFELLQEVVNNNNQTVRNKLIDEVNELLENYTSE